MKLREAITAAAVLAVAALIWSCSTGVESTPVIKPPSGMKATEEAPAAQLLKGVAPEAPSEWLPGKRWLVTDNKLSLLLSPESGSALPAELAGSMLTLVALAEKPGLTGDKEAVALLATAGDTLRMPLGMSMNALRRREVLALPFTIEESIVEEAQRRLVGRNAWTLTRLWRSPGDEPLADGRLFEPVVIDSVGFGTEQHPLRLSFHALAPDSLAGCFFITLARSTAPGDMRSLAGVIDLTNPWKRFPDIDSDKRAMISRGIVAAGMSPGEVRLALGAPASVMRGGSTATVLSERWLYDNGRILDFEDGILVTPK